MKSGTLISLCKIRHKKSKSESIAHAQIDQAESHYSQLQSQHYQQLYQENNMHDVHTYMVCYLPLNTSGCTAQTGASAGELQVDGSPTFLTFFATSPRLGTVDFSSLVSKT